MLLTCISHFHLAPGLIFRRKRSFLCFLNYPQTYANQAHYQEAVVSSLKGLEEKFQTFISKSSDKPLDRLLATTVKNKQEGKMNSIYVTDTAPVDSRNKWTGYFSQYLCYLSWNRWGRHKRILRRH